MSKNYQNVSVRLPEDKIDHADQLAEEYDTDRAAVLRELIDLGWMAVRDDVYAFGPYQHERRGAIQMTKDGEHPRWRDARKK